MATTRVNFVTRYNKKTLKAEIENDLAVKVEAAIDKHPRPLAFAEEVQLHWQMYEAPAPWNPRHETRVKEKGYYAEGDYAESIKIRKVRARKMLGKRGSRYARKADPGRAGRFLKGYEVYTKHPNAHFIEYGTWDDKKPGSPWGMKTPTAAFAPAARTAHHFS